MIVTAGTLGIVWPCMIQRYSTTNIKCFPGGIYDFIIVIEWNRIAEGADIESIIAVIFKMYIKLSKELQNKFTN